MNDYLYDEYQRLGNFEHCMIIVFAPLRVNLAHFFNIFLKLNGEIQ